MRRIYGDLRNVMALVPVLVLVGCGGGTATKTPGLKKCPTPDTGYPGDEMALCKPENGIQFHYGPGGQDPKPEDYEDPEELEKYTLGSFEEDENCFYTKSPEHRVTIKAYYGRYRPQSHHMIVWGMPNSDHELGVLDTCENFASMRFITGSQDEEMNIPPPGEEHPWPNTAAVIPPNTPIAFDMHYVNATDKEILREAWVNLVEFENPDEQVERWAGAIFHGDYSLNIPARTTGWTEGATCGTQGKDRQVALLTGHMHERGVRFSAWKVFEDGSEQLLYETYSWQDPGSARFNSVSTNPKQDPQAGQWGSPIEQGDVWIREGQYLRFECEYDNTDPRMYNFGNTAKNDEMCNLFGMYAPSNTNGDPWMCAVHNPNAPVPPSNECNKEDVECHTKESRSAPSEEDAQN